MIEIGRVCMKIAGRDAGKTVVVVEKIDDNFVIVDGNTKRRKCNIAHLEPLQEVLKIKKGETTEDVISEMKKAGIKIIKKEKIKRKPKEKKDATKKQRK